MGCNRLQIVTMPSFSGNKNIVAFCGGRIQPCSTNVDRSEACPYNALRGILLSAGPQATIVVVPRERFSFARRSLSNVFENTAGPFELIYVDAGTPSQLRNFLNEEADRRNFRIISNSAYLSPNAARNLGWSSVRTKYTVFLDNDALVEPGWLDQLVRCADETEAWVVCPLYLIGAIEKRIIHVAGGTLHDRVEDGRRVLYDEQPLFNAPLAKYQHVLKRRPCDYAEFHCMLVRTDVLDRLGPLDQGLLSLHEHIDLCLDVRKAGGLVLMEPEALTSYVPPPPGEWQDLAYFMLRWCEAWNLASVRHFNQKWGYDRLDWLGDKAPRSEEETLVRFARGHRRLMTGVRAGAGEEKQQPDTPYEQAEFMIALFLSIDRDSFDLALVGLDGTPAQCKPGLNPQDIFECLGAFMKEADLENLKVTITPRESPLPSNPALMRLDDLDVDAVTRIKPYAFLTLEVRPGVHQCWLAIDRMNPRSVEALHKLNSKSAPVPAATLAGSRNEGSTERVRLIEGVSGRLVGAHQLDRSDLTDIFRVSRIVN